MIKNYLEYIDINDIVRELKEEYKFETVLDTKKLISDRILKGVMFKDRKIKTSFSEYLNPFSQEPSRWYFFECPDRSCRRRIKKVYVVNGELGCRECLDVKSKFKINKQADRVFKIQNHLSELFSNKKITKKKKNQLIKFIVDHYNNLDDKYRLAYNTFVFKELQEWCLDNVGNKEKSADYKAAIHDVLSILKDAKNIIIRTNLSNSKNKSVHI